MPNVSLERKDVFIDGEFVPSQSSNLIEVVSPHSEKVVGSVPDGAPADIDAAVDAAARAVAGDWGHSEPAERVAVMRRLLKEYANRVEEVCFLQTTEMGCPTSQVRPVMVDPAIEMLRYYADLAEKTVFEEIRTGVAGASVVRRRPVGVVGAIVPWNGPPMLTMMKLGPAMAAGSAVVLKPAPESPLDLYLLAEAAIAANVPPGVLNIIPAGRETGEYLVTHPRVNKVAFTGSVAAGKRIGTLCGGLLRPVTLELGGKSAAIILEDADLEPTVTGLIFNALLNSGQVCAADTRILIPRSRSEEFTQAIVSAVAGLTIGDPFDPDTFIGPLVAERQRERVEGYIRSGIEQGATVALGAGRPAGLNTGWYVEPTVFTNVDNSMQIAREEIFGPVVALLEYDTEDQAVAISNDSDYGLAGSIWTRDVQHAVGLSARIETGTMAINTFGCQPCSPFGGVKSSGLGREMGPEGLDAYLVTQSVLGVPTPA